MSLHKTPLLQKLRVTGGTLYVSPSATEDIGLNLQASTTGAAMSHYALLNLPPIQASKLKNGLDIEGFNGNNYIAMSMQNYMMNFETFLTNQSSYNYQEPTTVSEKVFWKWLNKIGVISFDNSFTEIGNGVYKESNPDDSVIKCFGAIDAGNTLSSEFGMFNETYITIPTSYGQGPVYCTFEGDSNYNLNYTYTIASSKYLEGRENFKNISYTQNHDYPFTDNGLTYMTGSRDGMQLIKDPSYIGKALQSDLHHDDIVINSYDDLNITYAQKKQFEFNAILLYYSLYDQDDQIKTPYTTNLFGIIFLDGTQTTQVSNSEIAYYIPTLTKMQSDTENFGNSYAFRINLKTLSIYDNTDAIIQDNTTGSAINATMFSDVLANMNKAIDILNDNTTVIASIQNQYAAIRAIYDNQSIEIEDLQKTLDSYIKGLKSSFVNTDTVYTNRLTSSKNLESDPTVKLSVMNPDKTEYGESDFIELGEMTKDGILINSLDTSTCSYIYSYVKVAQDPTDRPAYNDQNFRAVIEQIFDSVDKSSNLNIKLRSSHFSQINGENYNIEYQNQAYIDPNSSIFLADSLNANSKLTYLKDGDNINYTGFIPFILYRLQTIGAGSETNSPISVTDIQDLQENKVDKALPISYRELAELIDDNGLTPGRLYRINDYETIVNSANAAYISANHPFDIIVIALTENTLSENATAVQREGDTYFTNQHLEAWELKYRFANDVNTFDWANSIDGKGVIYYMKDEYGNECPYDFKNIQFKSSRSDAPLISNNTYYYTFSQVNSNSVIDSSIDQSLSGTVFNNKILPYKQVSNNSYRYKLSTKILASRGVNNNTRYGIFDNIIHTQCNEIYLINQELYPLSKVTIGSSCNGLYMKNITNTQIGMNNSSIWARSASNITIGNQNSSIRFDFIAGNIIMDNYISNVYYGLGAMNVHINDFCQNLYLYRLTSCTIAPQCQNISINSAENTTIDSSCTNLTFGADIKNMQIGAGVKNMEFNYATGVTGTFQNVIIRPGVAFMESAPKIVTLQSTDLGLDETTIYQKGPDKVIDLLQ